MSLKYNAFFLSLLLHAAFVSIAYLLYRYWCETNSSIFQIDDQPNSISLALQTYTPSQQKIDKPPTKTKHFKRQSTLEKKVRVKPKHSVKKTVIKKQPPEMLTAPNAALTSQKLSAISKPVSAEQKRSTEDATKRLNASLASLFQNSVPRRSGISDHNTTNHYLSALKKRLQEHLFYPNRLKKTGITGVGIFAFDIMQNGAVSEKSLKVIESTNNVSLDHAALRSIAEAAPYQIPPHAPLHIQIPIRFTLKGYL